MNLTRRHIIFISLTFSLYCTIAITIFDPFVFLSAPNYAVSISLIFAACFISSLAISLFSRSQKSSIGGRAAFVLSFLIATTFAALSPWVIYGSDTTILLLYLSSFMIVSLLPMSIAVLWLIFDELKNKITISGEPKEEVQMIKLISDKGKVLVNLNPKKVICFEANDNYVVVYFLSEDDKLKKLMERTSLKRINTITDELNISFKRVHKSYLINPEFIQKIAGKSQAHRIHMEHIEEPIPVSRNFDIREIQG